MLADFGTKCRFVAAIIILLALVFVPAPLLPPQRLVEVVQRGLGIGWETAYLVAAVVLQVTFYVSVGVLAALVMKRAATLRDRLIQFGLTSIVVVGLALLLRSVKAGHLPLWINAGVPVISCLFGVALGCTLLYRHFTFTAVGTLTVLTAAFWGFFGGSSRSVGMLTEAHLRNLVIAGPALPTGGTRFGALLQAAFAPVDGGRGNHTQIDSNRAAIIAWGIAAGHPRLARLAGLDPDSQLVQQAAGFSAGTTLRGREDWSRHYAVSAALAVLGHPLISDAGGLMKEQIDALSGGTGFSFGDLAADRAGVRFASAATRSEESAKAMQARIQGSYSTDDFFPYALDVPENLTVEQFRHDFGGVGTERYHQEAKRIELLLDGCVALSLSPQQQ